MFSSHAPCCCYLSPTRGSNPGWHPDTMALPSCPCASIYPKCHEPRTGVCLPNTWKAYLTGTVMQTSEIMDQLCPRESGSACWRHDPGYRVNPAYQNYCQNLLYETAQPLTFYLCSQCPLQHQFIQGILAFLNLQLIPTLMTGDILSRLIEYSLLVLCHACHSKQEGNLGFGLSAPSFVK